MALTLYNAPGSSNALKVRMLLAELDLAHEVVDVPMDEPRPGWYTDINPFGRVPALRDGSAVLAESNTILRYLAAREGRTDLYPLDPLGRALVDWILDAWSMHVRPAAIGVERPLLFGPEPDLAAAEQALPAYVAALEKVEQLVRGDGTLCAGGITIADFGAAPTLYRANKVEQLPWERLPRLRAVMDAVLARPALAAARPVR